MKTAAGIGNKKLREALEEIKVKIRAIAGEDARLILYGSYARGEEREDSDVDIMVVLPDEKAVFKIKDEIRDAVFEIGFEADFLISTMIVSKSEERRFEGFKVFASVAEEGIPI